MDETISFEVTLDAAASDPVTVEWATSDGTATAGQDYVASSGALTFAPGGTARTIEVTVLDDAHDEGSETFALRLSNADGAEPAGVEPLETGIDLLAGAAGVRGTVVPASATGGFSLNLNADGLLLRATSESAPGLAAATADRRRPAWMAIRWTQIRPEGSTPGSVTGWT